MAVADQCPFKSGEKITHKKKGNSLILNTENEFLGVENKKYVSTYMFSMRPVFKYWYIISIFTRVCRVYVRLHVKYINTM